MMKKPSLPFTLLCGLWLLTSMITNAQPQPNIIYIMSDDHDADAISAYSTRFLSTPNIDRIGKEGMRFSRAFVGNSICGPARATLLTGQHSHLNGMIDNHRPFDASKMTMPRLLQQAGYQTAIVGKWHLQSYPVGFDYWRILPGQGMYYDPTLISMNGDTSVYKGYATEVITDQAIQWLDKRNQQQPFLLLLHHKAPHRNFVPRLKFLEQFIKISFPEPPTLFANMQEHGTAWKQQKMSILYDLQLCSDLKVDPALLADIPSLAPSKGDINTYHATMNRIPEEEREKMKTIYAERGKLVQQFYQDPRKLLQLKYQWYMQDFMSCVASVDENVGRLLNYLDKNKLTENTLLIYTSDQGFFLGENGWYDKRWMYDVSMQIPLLVRWPGKIQAASISDQLVQNIDFAPTIMQAAGQAIPEWMQGISLLPLLKNSRFDLGRKELYYHYYEYPVDHSVLPHLGIRGERYKLIYFYTVDEWEFYDLQSDPLEQNNLYASASHQTKVKEMKKRLEQIRDHYKDHEKAGRLD